MQMVKIGRLELDLETLKTRQELLDYFEEHDPTHSALMDFCEEYLDRYGDQLCWLYPISDGEHLGTFFVLVREGILSLPYNDADKIDCEIFCTEDIKPVTNYADMEIFLDDWKMFHNDLVQAMTGMKNYLYEQEAGTP